MSPRSRSALAGSCHLDKAACRQLGVAALALIGWTTAACGTNNAWALSSCEGTYAATSLQPLPAQIVVGLDIHDRSPANLKLADRFLAGVRSTGVNVGAAPNVVLHVTASVLGGTADKASRAREQYYPDMRGLGGGIYQALPPMPKSGILDRGQTSAQAVLYLRVDATNGQDPRISWVASAQCQMIGADSGKRAQELGRAIGETLGKQVVRRVL